MYFTILYIIINMSSFTIFSQNYSPRSTDDINYNHNHKLKQNKIKLGIPLKYGVTHVILINYTKFQAFVNWNADNRHFTLVHLISIYFNNALIKFYQKIKLGVERHFSWNVIYSQFISFLFALTIYFFDENINTWDGNQQHGVRF